MESVVERLRRTCLDLPEAVEARAWVGIRWTIRGKNFAHVLQLEGGRPKAYADAAGLKGSATLLTFRVPAEGIAAPRFRRSPFFKPVWFRDIVGMALDGATDWDEVDRLIVQSYCLFAPKRLLARLDRDVEPNATQSSQPRRRRG